MEPLNENEYNPAHSRDIEGNSPALPKPGSLSRRRNIYLGVFLFLAAIFYFFLISAPRAFPEGSIFSVNQGENLRNISLNLKESKLIRSRLVFEMFVVLYGGDKHLISADYLFEERVPVWNVARRISKGERHLAPVKVTIPEGWNSAEIAQIFSAKLPSFDEDKFLLLVNDRSLEGHLFPDTYFFFTTDTEEEVIKSMNDNFEKKISPLRTQIVSSGKSEKDIITMASLIEGEAKGDSDRRFISGILWKRLKINMPLQVDAEPATYQARGLPKSPIGSPGLAAIEAAIYPQDSAYLYYLHDREGKTHYARSFDEHRQNILKYLK